MLRAPRTVFRCSGIRALQVRVSTLENDPHRHQLKTRRKPVQKYQLDLKQISLAKKLNQLFRPPEPRCRLDKLITLERRDQFCRTLWRIIQPSAHFFYRR